MKRQFLALLLCGALLIGVLGGCANKRNAVQTVDLMAGIQAGDVKTSINISGPDTVAITDFALKLLQQTQKEEENILLSPLSVLCALAMTENGAKGETLAQMEALFGMDLATLNRYLYVYAKSLPQGENYKLTLANSIWIRDDERLTVLPEFLQANADWYGAGAYRLPFNDAGKKEINRWVKESTDGMIEGVLDEIDPDAVLYLINALAFDAEWQNVYHENQVWDDVFTAEDGMERDVEFLHAKEYRYLVDDKATGFMKNYADGKYAFAALLPNEGISVKNYVQNLTGARLHDMLVNSSAEPVMTAIPKFETEYGTSLAEALRTLGMTDAFDSDAADFTEMGISDYGSLFINDVIHKTYLKVDEKGTKAGAVTAVEVNESSAPIEEPKQVTLNRPFVYMIVDTEAMLPVFIGTMLDVE